MKEQPYNLNACIKKHPFLKHYDNKIFVVVIVSNKSFKASFVTPQIE